MQQRVTRLGTRRETASRPTCRDTLDATGRRPYLLQRRRDDLRPMSRPLVLYQQESARRERPSWTRGSRHSWCSDPGYVQNKMHTEGDVLAGTGLALTLVLAHAAHSEKSTMVAMAMLIRLRLRFIINVLTQNRLLKPTNLIFAA